MYTHILISTDGSELAQHGVDHGLSLAKALGSKVTIVTATEPFPAAAAGAMGAWVPAPVDYDGYDAGQQELAKGILSTAKAAAEKMGIEADTVHVPNSRPAVAIIDTAQQHDCNLIVMASHGRRGLTKVLLGSQTSEVLVTATIPVLVVR